jgi:preprotein translocase subunit YajC
LSTLGSPVVNYLPFLAFVLVIGGLLAFSARARRRQSQAQAAQVERIGVGSEVMTTSGLYGTVVVRNEDETVQMSIAPGVEVKWAIAALRDVKSLPAQYRRAGTSENDADDGDDWSDVGVKLDKPGLAPGSPGAPAQTNHLRTPRRPSPWHHLQERCASGVISSRCWP